MMTRFLRLKTWLRAHRASLIALTFSFALHTLATVGTPVWFDAGRKPEVAHFNAVLIPSTKLESAELVVRAKPLPAGAVPRTVPRRLHRASRPPKFEAAFIAPENAIAVEEPPGPSQDNAPTAERGADGKGADAPVTTAAGPVDAPIGPKLAPVAIENPALATVPVPATAPMAPLPSRVSISYNATSSIADGVAHYIWRRTGEKYSFESTIQASGFFAEMFAGTLTQYSVGSVTANGIAPAQFTIRRGNQEAETVEFQPATNEVKLSRGAESRQVAMPPNLQDTQSFLFQLAIEAVKLKSAEDRLTIFVTNARGINRYIFKKVGESTLETRFGTVETIHLVREISDPSDGYEVWLSPQHHYLPIKLKFFVGRFPAELVATTLSSTP